MLNPPARSSRNVGKLWHVIVKVCDLPLADVNISNGM
jgi:hypothetical protein